MVKKTPGFSFLKKRRPPSEQRRNFFYQGKVFDSIAEKRGHQLSNQYSGVWGALFAVMTAGWTKQMFRMPREEMLARAMKARGIKRVAEVGPRQNSFLEELRDVVKKPGMKFFAIAGFSEEGKKEVRGLGINPIVGRAGSLSARVKGNFDLIIAQNVFSLGGEGRSDPGKESSRKAIQNATKGTLDLLRMLSNNKNATIILAENWDALTVDRRKIEQFARILRWDKWMTEWGYLVRKEMPETELDNGWITPDEARVLREAPNCIVLQKKVAPKRA